MHYYSKLLSEMYGQAFSSMPLDDIHVAALNYIIQNELTDTERTVIIQKYQFNKTSNHIAQMLNTSIGNIHTIIRDAMFKLRSQILPAPMPIAIEAMMLKPRAYNSLKRANINTLSDIQKLPKTVLGNLRNIGVSTIQQIDDAIADTLTRRSQLYAGVKVINYSDIGMCPVCNQSDVYVVAIDNGYGEEYYSCRCNICKATWEQHFHKIHIDDGYEEIRDANGNDITVMISNTPLIDIDTVIQNAQRCHVCNTTACDLNIDGVCHYAMIYGKAPAGICHHGFELRGK